MTIGNAELDFAALRAHAGELIAFSLEEDLSTIGDITTDALIPPDATGRVAIAARRPGTLAGAFLVADVFSQLDSRVNVQLQRADGDQVAAGDVIAELSGSMRSLLVGERTCLNFLTLLCGVATATRRYVDAVAGTRARILDTRKTIPGWRLLQKYAVRCGGGVNHRTGLFDAVLMKDNHLAWWVSAGRRDLPAAIAAARGQVPAGTVIEIEVDSLTQLREALPAQPDIILLDNFSFSDLQAAVQFRDASGSSTLLEASGGVSLETVRQIAETGVERISVGALTHSAPALDLGFDWLDQGS